MSLANLGLKKVGNTTLNSGAGVASAPAVASGHTQVCLVQPAVALPDPGPRNLNDPSWPRRYQQFIESTQILPKYGQDSE
jgi:hypothetical protein